jgi:GTP-binding protein
VGHHAPNGGEGLSGEAEAADAAARKRGRVLFAGPCAFVATAARIDQIPATDRPEVAFAGRSNVGKSSLINALTGRRTLARTSVTPGRTQQLNFFDLAGRLSLADLPGYGYASAPKPKVEAWTRLVELYLVGRPSLRRALLLIDSRHGLKDIDRRIMAMLDRAAVSYQVILTKADKIDAAALARRLVAIEGELRGHSAVHPALIATSARSGAGIDDLRASLAALSEWAAETPA